MEYRAVVTCFLQVGQRILLLRRSAKVGTHKRKWSAISGYLEGSEEPLQRAHMEISEEVSLGPKDISLARAGETLRAFDEQTGTVWVVYPFLFEAWSKRIRLDWENTEYKWVEPSELRSYETVPKLKETFDRVRCDLQSESPAISKVLRGVEELAKDRVHGASFLGRRAVDLMSAAARTSQAATAQELFCDLLIVASRLRTAQPEMATIRNLLGQLLYQADLKSTSVPTVEIRNVIDSLAKELIERAQDAAEDASRNAVGLLPTDGHVLTHSYSNTVSRALELGMKSGRRCQVYVTESYPGMEGKQLAKGLVEFGIPVKLVADLAVGSMLPDVDLVVVGADSVLADGSLLHKVGTKNIAIAAHELGIPFCSVCQTTKFSTADFLREPVHPSGMFDITPSEYVSKFITEGGSVEPREVEGRIKLMLREIYP